MRELLKEMVALTHELDPGRPAAIGGCQRGDYDKVGDIAGYNGDGARLFMNPGIPSVVTEYGSTVADRPGDYAPGWGDLQQEQFPWRSGQALWCAFDHGSIAGHFGSMGMIDYFRLPKRQWYWYRNEYKKIPPPEWPGAGTPAGLRLSADKTALAAVGRHGRRADRRHGRGRGRQADEQLPAGHARDRVRTRRISDRPGHHVCAGLGHCDSRRHGRDRVQIVLCGQERDPRDVAGVEGGQPDDHFRRRAGFYSGKDPACGRAALCALSPGNPRPRARLLYLV